MKNLKWKLLFTFLFAFSASAFFAVQRTEAAEIGEGIKVTVENNMLEYDLSLAFCYESAMGVMDSSGWYNVPAGAIEEFWIKEAFGWSTHLHDTGGYYAKGTTKDGKTLYWHGKDDANPLKAWIHPNKAFNTTESSGPSDPGGGGLREAPFRRMRLDEGNMGHISNVRLRFDE